MHTDSLCPYSGGQPARAAFNRTLRRTLVVLPSIEATGDCRNEVNLTRGRDALEHAERANPAVHGRANVWAEPGLADRTPLEVDSSGHVLN